MKWVHDGSWRRKIVEFRRQRIDTLKQDYYARFGGNTGELKSKLQEIVTNHESVGPIVRIFRYLLGPDYDDLGYVAAKEVLSSRTQ